MTLKLKKQNPSVGQIRAVFQNHDRIDERIIFDNAISKLKSAAGIIMSAIKSSPYSDFAEGICDKGSFKLYLDFDYGVDIRAQSEDAIDCVMSILES